MKLPILLTLAFAMVAFADEYEARSFTGPDGGTPEKPVGLVYFAAGRRDAPVKSEKVEFGDLGRNEVQRRGVAYALKMLRSLL